MLETPAPVDDACHVELPRRSLRKLSALEDSAKSEKSEKTERPTASLPNNVEKVTPHDSKPRSKSSPRTSKTKSHRSKARHHKEKRKKRKHHKIKDANDAADTVENRGTSDNSWEFDLDKMREKCSQEFLPTATHEFSKDSNDSLELENILVLPKSCHNVSQKICPDAEKTDTAIGQNHVNKICSFEDLKMRSIENDDTQALEARSNSNEPSELLGDPLESSAPLYSHSEKVVSLDQRDSDNVQFLNCDNASEECKSPRQESSEACGVLVEFDRNNDGDLASPRQKHIKKRHRGIHQNKKHRDVRKAPQDGMIHANENPNLVSHSNDSAAMSTIDAAMVPDSHSNGLLSEPTLESTEPVRLAIKIKLCQECNSRHLQDTCPLKEPESIVKDSILLEHWIHNYSKNPEVMKAYGSDDPMSQGYGENVEDSFESDEEMSEQCKSKVKVDSEEKQHTIDTNKPLYARDSLPDCLELKFSNVDHGVGVFIRSLLPKYTQLGPLIGKSVQEMDIPDDFPMRHIWEV